MKNETQVVIDNNPSLRYEKTGCIYFLIILAMVILTPWVVLKKMVLGKNLKINTFWFDGLSPICREVKENATGWRALDIIYNYIPGQDKTLSGRITDFWNQLKNITALRNRLRLTTKVLKETIENLLIKESEIRLVSIASGSAQGVIEVMAEFKQKSTIIKAIFLDLDPTAIEHSKKLAQETGILNQITFINKSAKYLEEAVRGFNPQIVEIVGFIEYRPKERAIALVKRIHSLLTPKGVLLISSVSPSLEKLFTHYVGNWPMFYRNLKEFIEIIISGEFKSQNIKIIYEPLKVQKIAVCRKSS